MSLSSLQPNGLEDVTAILVSFKTKDLTLKAFETLFANAGNVRMRVIVWARAFFDQSGS